MPGQVTVFKKPFFEEAVAHCQVTLDTLPSPSVSEAVISTSSWGCCADRVTSPFSLRLVTLIVMSIVSSAVLFRLFSSSTPSRTRMVTSYSSLVS